MNREAVGSIEDFVEAVNGAGGDVVSLLVDDPEIGRTIVNYELRP